MIVGLNVKTGRIFWRVNKWVFLHDALSISLPFLMTFFCLPSQYRYAKKKCICTFCKQRLVAVYTSSHRFITTAQSKYRSFNLFQSIYASQHIWFHHDTLKILLAISAMAFKLDHVLLIGQDKNLTSHVKCVIIDRLWSFGMEDGNRITQRRFFIHSIPSILLTSFHLTNFSSVIPAVWLKQKDTKTKRDNFFKSLTDLLSSKSISAWIWARIISPQWHRNFDNEKPQLSLMPDSVVLRGDLSCDLKISPSLNSCVLFLKDISDCNGSLIIHSNVFPEVHQTPIS